MASLPDSGSGSSRATTDLTALQDELAELRSELTAQQEQNEQLRQQLRDTHQAVGMFVYCFHGALPTLSRAVEIMGDPERDEAARRRAHGVARRQFEHLRQVMKSLRESFRVTYGLTTLDCCAVAVVPIVQEALKPYQDALAAKTQQLEVSVPAESPVIWADPSRVVQMIGYLLENAIRCTPAEGRIAVHVETLPSWVVIRIPDTGRGMSADQLTFLSEQFKQRDPYTGGLPSGLGSSLSIVHGLMRLHGGTVDAQSEGQGLGSEFTLRFPLYEPGRPTTPSA